MFCTQCGTKLLDNASFCFRCGTKVTAVMTSKGSSAGCETKLVEIKCSNCGAKLTVDSNLRKATCFYCGAEFFIEREAVNVPILDKQQRLLMQAQDFEKLGELEKAMDSYNQVLDIDFEDMEAKGGIKRIRGKMDNFVYYEGNVPSGEFGNKKIIWRNALAMMNTKGKKTVYYFDRMENLRLSPQLELQFEYPGKQSTVTLGGAKNKEIFEFIQFSLCGLKPLCRKL